MREKQGLEVGKDARGLVGASTPIESRRWVS